MVVQQVHVDKHEILGGHIKRQSIPLGEDVTGQSSHSIHVPCQADMWYALMQAGVSLSAGI